MLSLCDGGDHHYLRLLWVGYSRCGTLGLPESDSMCNYCSWGTKELECSPVSPASLSVRAHCMLRVIKAKNGGFPSFQEYYLAEKYKSHPLGSSFEMHQAGSREL